MVKAKVFEKKVNAACALIFCASLLTLIFFNWLPIWASVITSLFVAVTLRQFLIGKLVDVFVSFTLFAALFITNSFFYSEIATGVLLLIGGTYIFVRQCFDIYSMKKSCSENSSETTFHLSEDDPGN